MGEQNEGDRIKELREYLGLSQAIFGERILLERSTISLIERQQRKITDRIMKDICREFNVNEEWLRTGEGEMLEQLTESQKVMKYTALLLKDTDSVIASAIKNFIVTYEQLDETSKGTLNKVVEKYFENAKKSQ